MTARAKSTRAGAKRTRRLRAPLLLAGALLLLGNDGLRLDTLLRDFDIVAFGAEFGQKTDGRLHKWTGPIRYFFDIRAGEAELYRRLTRDHLALLRQLTGIDVIEVDSAGEANVVIIFDRAESLFTVAERYAPSLSRDKQMMGDTLCFTQYSHSASGEILRGVVGIPSDRAASAGKLPHCIVEETTQLLGLPNDSDEVVPSMFDDRSVLNELTEHDKVLVRLLYDRRLPAGMPRERALAVARQILREQGF
jgi:hypothetical protein